MPEAKWSEKAAERLLKTTIGFRKNPVNKQARELSFGEMGLLNYLFWENKGVTAGSISRMMGIGSGGVANLLNSLEKKGCLQREMSPSDRRSVLVFISERGRELIHEKQRMVTAMTAEVLERLGREDTEALIALLERFCVCGEAVLREKEGEV